jgi:glycosyltransferase involved in cell wall biosynthesis
MRIGLEVRALHRGYRGSGQWRYAFNLLRALAQQDREHEYELFAPYPSQELDFPPISSSFRYSYRTLPVPLHRGRAWLWEQVILPAFLRARGLNVCHFLLQMSVRLAPCKVVVTAHDAIYELFPEYAHIRKSRNYRWQTRALRKADRLLAISSSTRDDVIRLYHIDPEKVLVIPHAADPVFRPLSAAGELEGVRSKYHLPPRFVLSVLSYEPRKNTLGAIRGFASFVRKTGFQHCLVLFGDRGWGVARESIDRAIAETGVAEYVRVVGRLPDEELVALYNLAEFFVFPSLYEGFGLPVLEALACGRTVVAANASSMPEVLGDAGLLVNVTNVEELADAMARIGADNDLRHALEKRALAQAGRFSWLETAQRVLEVYQDLGRSRPSSPTASYGAR